MDEKLAGALLIAAIMVLLLVTVSWLEAETRGWEQGRDESRRYYKETVTSMKERIESRERTLAMYRDISTTLCDNMSDCMYCPYERDKNDDKCALWKLNENVERFDIKEVHVGTKHDGGDGD